MSYQLTQEQREQVAKLRAAGNEIEARMLEESLDQTNVRAVLDAADAAEPDLDRRFLARNTRARVARKHYHWLAAGTHVGMVVEHVHSTPRHRHVHEGLVGYSTSRVKADRLARQYVDSFRAYLRSVGSITSPRKAASSRENGKKGGRPKSEKQP